MQPKVTPTAPNVPQTDAYHGGRALCPTVPPPVVATQMVPMGYVHQASPSQLVGNAFSMPSSPHSASAVPIAASYAHVPPPPPPPQQLPPGWQALTAPDGQTYYVDHNTKTTSWTLPHHL